MSKPENEPEKAPVPDGIAAKPPHTDIADVVEVALKADPELALEPASVPKAKSGNNIKMAIDFAAPLAFGLTYFLAGKFGHFADKNGPLLLATGVLAVVSLVALIAAFIIEKRLAWMPLFAGGFAVVFGGLTLLFNDPHIIMFKVTVQNYLFGGVLLGGLWLKKNPLKALMGEFLPLKDEAWGGLTLAYGLLFITIGSINEVIWRTQDEAIWVTWKSSLFIVTLIFSVCLTPYLMKHMKTDEDGGGTKS